MVVLCIHWDRPKIQPATFANLSRVLGNTSHIAFPSLSVWFSQRTIALTETWIPSGFCSHLAIGPVGSPGHLTWEWEIWMPISFKLDYQSKGGGAGFPMSIEYNGYINLVGVRCKLCTARWRCQPIWGESSDAVHPGQSSSPIPVPGSRRGLEMAAGFLPYLLPPLLLGCPTQVFLDLACSNVGAAPSRPIGTARAWHGVREQMFLYPVETGRCFSIHWI